MDPDDRPTRSTPLTGLALLTLLVGIAAVWLFFQAPSAGPTQQLQPALDSTAVAGFLTEQWFLPDTIRKRIGKWRAEKDARKYIK